MRERPPPQLMAMLDRLGLAGAAEFRRVESRVRRLARDLPQFESLWIDALAQGRILTPFQAAQLNAGRGERLRVGPYVLCQPVRGPLYVACYQARRFDTGETARLAVAEGVGSMAENTLRQLEALAAAFTMVRSEHFAAITECGADGGRLWASSPWTEGRTAAEWMVHHGRFSSEAVLEIARAMAAGLALLESDRRCHGDVCTSSVMLTDRGEVVLLQPGLRGVMRPEEGYAHAELRPEAYDGVAPERIEAGTPPTVASDVFACGCLWWHLLCGRAPLAGGDSLAKLRAAQTARIEDVRRLASETPAVLAETIAACVQRDPQRRPESMTCLAKMLGPRTRGGRQALARCLAGAAPQAAPWLAPIRPKRPHYRAARLLTASAAALMVLAGILWPIWSSMVRQRPTPQEAIAEVRSVEKDPTRSPGGRGEPAVGGVARSEMDHRARRDASVVPAGYETASSSEGGGDLVLPSDQPVFARSISLKPGQLVRPARGRRAQVVVPQTGLAVRAEDVRLEGIDFVWKPSTRSENGEPQAVLHLYASRIELHSCSFETDTGRETHPAPAAILWTHPVDRSGATMALPSGRVRMSNCLFRRVGAGIDCRTLGARGIELVNGLYQGPGALVRLDHAPTADEPVRITLSQVTLRDAEAVVECRCARSEGSPGEIAIEATGCVLAPGALMVFSAEESPEPLLRKMSWTGQGSLVAPQSIIALWRRAAGDRQTLDDSLISMAGLVRSSVEFAGSTDGPPADSRVLRWQAPLQSADAPGVDVDVLPRHDGAGKGTASDLGAESRHPS